MSGNHDLNALTLELAREKNITWSEARRLLAQRGAGAKARNRRGKRAADEKLRRRVAREERMGLV